MPMKTFRAELKARASGEIEAVFALLNTPDLDRDVTLPGAFGRQSTIIEPWNHDYGSLPVGQGEIIEEDNQAILRGKLFLNTQSGQEHYQALKALGDLTQWSYSFRIVKSYPGKWTDGTPVQFLEKLEVYGVSPVTRGAQPLTSTRSD